MTSETVFARSGPAVTARPSHLNTALKAPVAVSVALTKAGRGVFDMWDENDDLPALAMIIPLGVLSIYTIWAVISSL
ncbi:MAG TPA: hypothetical protein VNS79_10720 [Sphingobium sp.]|nr:hypothetical protein [Sphingobium sp.]